MDYAAVSRRRSTSGCGLALVAALVCAEEPVDLHPCSTLLRPGTMNESGAITRPDTPREFATAMTKDCDYVVLGRFVSVSDRHYDEFSGPWDEPVNATFRISEVLLGMPLATVKTGLQRGMLVAPGKEVNRYQSSLQDMEDDVQRHKLVTEVEHELDRLRDSGQPLTGSQHQRLLDSVKRLTQVPTRTRREQHDLINGYFSTNSPLSFYSELGAIRPSEVYLLGLSNKDDARSLPRDRFFHALHTYLLWGQEALDVAAALREGRD